MVIPAIPSVYSRGSDFPQQWEGTEQAAAFSSMQRTVKQKPKKKPRRATGFQRFLPLHCLLKRLPLNHLRPDMIICTWYLNPLLPSHPKRASFPPHWNYLPQRTQKIHILRCSSKLQWRVCKDTRTCVSGPTSLCLGCIFLSMEVTWGYGEPRWLKPPHGAYFEHK